MTEAQLRDSLAKQIKVLQPDLVLLDKERFIPNEFGTRSFIDLYARDSNEHHVLIELKRTGAASREAIHEVHNYVEGVKQHFGARENEIIVIIVSAEWRELLVPFSRLLVDSTLAIRGMQLRIDATDNSLHAEPIAPLDVSYGRFIAPWHEVYWYLDRESLERGLISIEESFGAKGINDYVVAVLRPPMPCASEHQAGVFSTLMQISRCQGGSDNLSMPSLPTYEFIAYVAMQMLPDSKYLEILNGNAEALAEVSEYLSSEPGEERLQQLHEAVSALDPRPTSDHLEIGYAAKITKFLDNYGFVVSELRRKGHFSRNTILSDEAILAEFRGEDGSTGQRFRRTISMSNRAHVASARRDIASCLEQNLVWGAHISRALDEIERAHPFSEVDISIYNPSTGLLTIYLTTTREDGVLYVPTYSIIVKSPNPCQMYFGALESGGSSNSFRQILKKYYDNDLGSLLFTMTWGGYEPRDVDILEDMGAFYRSFRCDIEGADDREVYALRDDRWRTCKTRDALDLWGEYLEQNAHLVREVVVKVGSCDKGTYFETLNGNMLIERMIDIERGEADSVYLPAPLGNCCICDCSMIEEEIGVVAVSADHSGPILCIDCFAHASAEEGTEAAAIYLNKSGGWLKVGPIPKS